MLFCQFTNFLLNSSNTNAEVVGQRKVQSKVVSVHAMKAYRESRDVALLVLNLSHRQK
jgi:hypothetical protein